MKSILLFTPFFLFFCAGVVAQMPATESELNDASVFLAKDDGKGAPGKAADVFSVSDIPIHCVVKLGDTGTVTVKMYLVAVKVVGLKADSRVVSASYTTTEGQNEVFFNGRPHKVWFAGNYRADIFVDGKPFRSLDFIVTAPKVDAKANSFAPKSAVTKPRRPRSRSKIN